MSTHNHLPLYCNSLTSYSRFQTTEVRIGEKTIGGKHPLLLQSMTTADTMDTDKTVAESVRMIDAGCELVRITAPSLKEAENLRNIREALRERGYTTPIVADIHFTPNAAELAAKIVEKVRVNPGNYADKKKFEEIVYTDETYQAELARIRERFTPLVLICKEHGTAMRIGTNHGSLSDRILSRYGDTPKGMVESAMEFLQICRDHHYHDIVISMKASNAQVMVQAYRLLVAEMKAARMNYPLHLGVTEAGDGEDGRIKSAVGIGTLLEDGLGDTIRVSLTEPPEMEIPVARMLAERYQNRAGHQAIPEVQGALPYDPYSYHRRDTREVMNIGARHVPVVIADLSDKESITPANLFAYGYHYSVELDKWNLNDQACDFVYTGNTPVTFEIPGTLGVLMDLEAWEQHQGAPRHYPVLRPADCTENVPEAPILFVRAGLGDISGDFIRWCMNHTNVVLVLETNNEHGMAEQRRAFIELMQHNCPVPVIVKRTYRKLDEERFQLYGATDLGALLLDGMGDGIWLDAAGCASPQVINRTAFNILQATRTRISKTEYISCPSCGRTLFDLQETTAKIRARTHHLKGVKIGIMGCIVNGPGEMADADYGYVGTGAGKITLYKEKEVVKRNVPEQDAVDELIELIRAHGDWVEPSHEAVAH
jgi:(E)-4-hydroxy-3-methylbut-2-enyl-diphosphate synthase